MYRSGNIEIFFHILTCSKIVLIDSVKNDFQKFRALWLANSQISFDIIQSKWGIRFNEINLEMILSSLIIRKWNKNNDLPIPCLLLQAFDLPSTKWCGPVAWSQYFGKRSRIPVQPPIDPLCSQYWQSREQLEMQRKQEEISKDREEKSKDKAVLYSYKYIQLKKCGSIYKSYIWGG